MLANAAKEVPFEQLSILGIAVKKFELTWSHVGVLYRDGDGAQVRLLHFKAEAKLQDEVPDASFFWLQCEMDEINRKIVASRCPQIFQRARDRKIPYGISYDGSYFDGAGQFVRDVRPEDGLTCATFVIALFRWLGFEVLDPSTWPVRPEDEAWQERIVQVMEQRWKVPKRRISAQRRLIGNAARFRPEEVAVATAKYVAAPFTLAHIQRDAEELEAQLYDSVRK